MLKLDKEGLFDKKKPFTNKLHHFLPKKKRKEKR